MTKSELLSTVLPIALLIVQTYQALVLYSIRSAIKISQLEMREQLAREHYTKDEVDRKLAAFQPAGSRRGSLAAG